MPLVYSIKETSLISMANHVRAKGGITELLSIPEGFNAAIDAINGNNDELLNSIVDRTASDLVCTASSVGDDVFRHFESLVSARFPNAASFGNDSFYGCKNLSSIDTENVQSIGNSCFYHCDALTSIEFSYVTSVGYNAFAYCKNITKIALPMATTIKYGAFSNCDSLTEIDVSSVQSLDFGTFDNCNLLHSITLPSVISMNNPFSNCNRLNKIVLPGDTVCALQDTLGDNMYPGVRIEVNPSLLSQYKDSMDWYDYQDQIFSIA